ncbi:MAG: pilus assembly protein PilP [Gammaproteobacteria bacterium]|jgi:type IV pilus assembly protein PilP
MKFASNRVLGVAACACVSLMLSGCVNRDMSDLEDYASDVISRPGGRIEPLPPIKPYERYLYASGEQNQRDPFRSFFRPEPEAVPSDPSDDPNQRLFATEVLTHNREELERVELDSLRMVGILENNNELWGIVRDPAGTVHRVQVGNYVGANYGKILHIQEDRIELREIVKDSQGLWEERQATLALSED